MNSLALMRVAQIEVDVAIFYKIPQDLHRQIFFHRLRFPDRPIKLTWKNTQALTKSGDYRGH